jgi:phosphate ABC transporter phosphate-binding protein
MSFGSQSSNTVNYNPAGSGAGITAFTGKTVDFAGTDVGLNSSQTAALTSPVVTVPITAGGLAIVYNVPGVASGLKLSGPVLANIYLGKVHTWNDPSIAANNSGVSLPNQPITTVHRSDSAGTTFILTDYFSQDSPAWASGPGTGLSVSWPVTPSPSVAEKGNSGIAKYVTANAYSIGYVDLTDSVLAKLSYAKLQNPAGNFVLPTPASVASAIADKSATTTFPNATGNWGRVTMVNANGSGDYPLATFAYFFVYQGLDKGYAPSLLKAEVIVAWLKWAVTTGQSFAAGLYYTALAATIVSVDQKAIGTLTYGGKAVPACSLT